MLFVPIRFLLRSGARDDAARSVEAGMHIVHDNGAAVNVSHVDVHVHHRAVVKESATPPLAAGETYAAISEAIVNAAVESDMRSPIARMPAIKPAGKSPVARSPKHADRRNHPCAGNPVIAAVIIPSPIPRGPEIARAGSDRLRVHRQRRRTETH